MRLKRMRKGVLFLIFMVIILIFTNGLFFVYYSGNDKGEVKEVFYDTDEMDSEYYEDDILRESYSYNNDVIKLNADKNVINENQNILKKIIDKSGRKRSSGRSSSRSKINSEAKIIDDNFINSVGDNNTNLFTPAISGAVVNNVNNTSIDINNENNSKAEVNIVVNNTDDFRLDDTSINNKSQELNQSELNETLIYPQGPDVGFCQYNFCDSPVTSYESDEGPGGSYCCPAKAPPYSAAGYEECTNYFIKSTANVKNDYATDFCTDSHTLKEAFLDCDIGNDDLYYKIKDCNDFDFYGDYEYYCIYNKVKKHQRFSDIGCGDGACEEISNTYINEQVISQLGDSDYCAKRKQGVNNDWAGCTLCEENDYDCDSNSECSSGLQCKGTLGPSSSDGCCSTNAKWDSSLKICCISHYSHTCYDNDVYYYDSCGIKEDKALECGEDSCGSFGNNYCKNGDVYKKRTCYDRGCSNNDCFSHSSIDEQLVQDCDYDCSNGQCIPKPACFSNSDCGTDGYIDEQFCSVNQLKRTYRTYTCSNPGTQSAFCSHSDIIQTIDDCNDSGCSTSGYFCKDSDVYYTLSCNNEVGCVGNACKIETNSTDVKVYECGSDSCDSWGSNFCSDGDVYRSRTCFDKGCSDSVCFSNPSTENEKVSECGSLGCSNGQCNTCQTHNSYSCSEGDVYWYNSCSVKEDKKQECGDSGFVGGNYCFDNDVYKNYTTKGCSGNSCTTNTEKQKQNECGANGCSNGQCNSCQTHSYYQCFDNDVYWYNACNVKEDKKQECGSSGCANGQCIVSCTNECSTSGAKQCSGSNLQTCGNYDSDSCLEWGGDINCQYGCSNGQCNPQPCVDECVPAGQTQCNGNTKQTCGNYDSDSCLEWGNNVSCPNGCSNNQCNNQCSDEYPLSCNNLCYQCSSNYPVLFCPTDVNASKFCYSSISSCKSSNSNNVGMCVSKFACYVNADCGTNGFIGTPACSNNDLIQTHRTYTCNNANSASANCSFSDVSQIKEDCGDSGYNGSNYCFDGDVYREYISRGCSNNGCFANTQKQKQQECGSLQCANGVCVSEKQATINLNAGVNLFSLPLVPSGGAVSFGSVNNNCIIASGGVGACSVQNIAYLNPNTGNYICLNVNSALHPGQGYFVKVLNACSLTVRGNDLASNKIGYLGTNTIKKGENLIGAPTNAVSFSSIKNTCDVEDPLMFVYGVTNCNGIPNYSGKNYCGFSSLGYNYCYCSVSQLVPGKGYNLYSDKECAFR